jgi:hypothetical protein
MVDFSTFCIIFIKENGKKEKGKENFLKLVNISRREFYEGEFKKDKRNEK